MMTCFNVMDCVRVSTREIKDRKWDAFYYQDQTDPMTQTKDGCRQSCVSKKNCKAWQFNDSKCSLTFALKGYYPQSVKEKGTYSGLIQCKNEAWSMLKLVLYFLLFIVIFAIFVWIGTRCPKK